MFVITYISLYLYFCIYVSRYDLPILPARLLVCMLVCSSVCAYLCLFICLWKESLGVTMLCYIKPLRGRVNGLPIHLGGKKRAELKSNH